MKRLIIIVAAFVLLVSAVNLFAQAPVTGLTGKGFKVGLNLAKFTGSDVTEASMRTAFVFGGFITYSFTELFAIQPELLYSMKGSKRKVFDEQLSENVDVTYKLNYIEIPVLFRIQLAGGGNFKPNFYAGPEIGILLSAKGNGTTSGVSVDVDIKDQCKSTDIGLIGGVGADYLMGTGKLTFDIRYDAGLSKVFKAVNGFPEPKVNNSAITFLVGYGF
jgi:hypothetical protein